MTLYSTITSVDQLFVMSALSSTIIFAVLIAVFDLYYALSIYVALL